MGISACGQDVTTRLAVDTHSMSSASAHSMHIQSEMNNVTADANGGLSWAVIVPTVAATGGLATYAAYSIYKRNGKNSVEINPGEFTDEQLHEEKLAILNSLSQAQRRLNITKGITIGSGVVATVVLAIAAVIRAKKIYNGMQSKSILTQPVEEQTVQPRQWIFDSDERFQRIYNWDTLSLPVPQQSFISEKWSSIQKNEKIVWLTGLGMLIPVSVAGWKWYDYSQQIEQLEEKLSAIEIEQLKRIKTSEEATNYYDALALALDRKYNMTTPFIPFEEIELEVKALLALSIDELNEMNNMESERENVAAGSAGRRKRDIPCTSGTKCNHSYFDLHRSRHTVYQPFFHEDTQIRRQSGRAYSSYSANGDSPAYPSHSASPYDSSFYASTSTQQPEPQTAVRSISRPDISPTTTVQLAKNLHQDAAQRLSANEEQLTSALVSLLKELEEQVGGIPRHLSGPLPYVTHEGNKLFRQYNMPDKFDPKKEISISYKKWDDNPWHWFLSLLTYSTVLFAALEESGVTHFRDAFRGSAENKGVALQDLLLGKLKNIIGHNTYDIRFPEPQQLYRDMYSYNLQDRYMKDLAKYLSDNGDQARQNHRAITYGKIRKQFIYRNLYKDQDIISLVKNGTLEIYRTKLTSTGQRLFNTYVLHDTRLRGSQIIDGVETVYHDDFLFSLNDDFPGAFRVVHRGPQTFEPSYFGQAFKLIKGCLGNIESISDIVHAIPEHFFSAARRETQNGPYNGYTKEIVDSLQELCHRTFLFNLGGKSYYFTDKLGDMRYEYDGKIEVKNGELDFSEDFNEMIERLKEEMDGAAISNSEAATLAGLYYFELAVNIFTTMLSVASLAVFPATAAYSGTMSAVISAIATYSGPVALATTVLTTTGINITRAAIADNSEDYQNAIIQLAINLFYEAAAFLGAKALSAAVTNTPLPKRLKDELINKVAREHVDKVMGKLYDTANMEYSNSIKSQVSAALSKL